MASKACAWAWRASQAALIVRSLPTNARDRRARARSLRREDPLECGMATHSSVLPWRSQRTEELGGLWS